MPVYPNIHIASFRNSGEALSFQNVLAKDGLCTVLEMFPTKGWYRLKVDLVAENPKAINKATSRLKRRVKMLRRLLSGF